MTYFLLNKTAQRLYEGTFFMGKETYATLIYFYALDYMLMSHLNAKFHQLIGNDISGPMIK